MKKQKLICRVCNTPSGEITTIESIGGPQGYTEFAGDITLEYSSTIEGGSLFSFNLAELEWEKMEPINDDSGILITEEVFVCAECERNREKVFQNILKTLREEKLEELLKGLESAKDSCYARIIETKEQIKKWKEKAKHIRKKLKNI